MKKSFDAAKREWTWSFNGDVKPVVFNVDSSPKTQDACLVFGYGESIGNAAALSRNGKDGKVITITDAMRREAIVERIATIESGEWAKRSGAKSRVEQLVDVACLINAIVEETGKSVEGVTAFVMAKDENGRLTLSLDSRFSDAYIEKVAAKRPKVEMDEGTKAEFDAIE